MVRMKLLWACAVGCGFWFTPTAQAVDVKVTIHNLSPADGVALSPVFLAAHDGTFDMFNTGAAASAAVENVAELGDGTGLLAAVGAAQPSAVATTAIATMGGFGPGIYAPGASGSVMLSLDPAMNRYLSFASMVVPSNDAFVGNDSPTSIQLFDAGGNFVATDFMLTGSDIWDAGTEVNQLLGAAYIVGQDATLGTNEGGVVHAVNLATQFTPYLGGTTPLGATFSTVPGATAGFVSVSFEVVPEPATAVLVGVALCGGMAMGRGRRYPEAVS